MKPYYITYQDKETQDKYFEMWDEIETKGKFKKFEYDGDYMVTSYDYNGKAYKLFFNDELGIRSHIIEYDKEV